MLAGASALAAAPIALEKLECEHLTIDQFSDRYIKPAMLTHRDDLERILYKKPIRFMGRG